MSGETNFLGGQLSWGDTCPGGQMSGGHLSGGTPLDTPAGKVKHSLGNKSKYVKTVSG